MVRKGDRFQTILVLLAALALIGNHGFQFLGLTIAVLGTILRPLDVAGLDSQGVPQWAFYYGPSTGFIESIAFVVLAIALLRGHARARIVLLWLLPLALVHDVGYTIVLGANLSDGIRYFTMDIVSWIALLTYSSRAKMVQTERETS